MEVTENEMGIWIKLAYRKRNEDFQVLQFFFSNRIAIAFAFPLFISVFACTSPEEERMEAFEAVCRTIDERFYDPEFNGRDWDAIVDEYRPRVANVKNDEKFFVLVNEMLFELGVSHLGLIPDEHPEWIGAPAVFADGEVGIDVRLIEGHAVAVKVRAGSPADKAGILPGALLLGIDGKSLDDMQNEALKRPSSPLDEQLKLTQAVQQGLFGPSGEETTVRFANYGDEEREVTLRRIARPGRSIIMEGIPPSYLEIEFHRVEENVGYLRFNAFDLSLLDDIQSAIDSFEGTNGMVIDLRGNTGGVFQVRRALAERLVTAPCTIWIQSGRRGAFEVNLTPPPNAYRGLVVVLTDILSCSSAEELSGGLQALGRAVVVGQKTAGVVLIADLIRLDIGATLVYPEAKTILADGSVLEGHGVVPDIEIQFDRKSLAAGRDLQLEAALKYIHENAGE
jgi:carboxyl-terminal processing protease